MSKQESVQRFKDEIAQFDANQEYGTPFEDVPDQLTHEENFMNFDVNQFIASKAEQARIMILELFEHEDHLLEKISKLAVGNANSTIRKELAERVMEVIEPYKDDDFVPNVKNRELFKVKAKPINTSNTEQEEKPVENNTIDLNKVDPAIVAAIAAKVAEQMAASGPSAAETAPKTEGHDVANPPPKKTKQEEHAELTKKIDALKNTQKGIEKRLAVLEQIKAARNGVLSEAYESEYNSKTEALASIIEDIAALEIEAKELQTEMYEAAAKRNWAEMLKKAEKYNIIFEGVDPAEQPALLARIANGIANSLELSKMYTGDYVDRMHMRRRMDQGRISADGGIYSDPRDDEIARLEEELEIIECIQIAAKKLYTECEQYKTAGDRNFPVFYIDKVRLRNSVNQRRDERNQQYAEERARLLKETSEHRGKLDNTDMLNRI